jgi:Flp pilus assembly protein TadG
MLKWRSIFGPWFLSKPSWSETKRAQYGQGVLREEGATLVEMALCSSVLLSMVFGIIGLSMAFYAYDFVSNAAREGARWAIVRGSQSCSNTPNLTNCNATWFTASAAPPTTWSTCTSGTCNIPGNGVQVKVTYAVPLGVPFVNVTTMTLGSTSFMVISQ